MLESKTHTKRKIIKTKNAKAVDRYKKMISDSDITDKQKLILEEKIKNIEKREIIEKDPMHIPNELKPEKQNQILAGPSTLTRFEKARIIGARALQLSLGAPPFIEIPRDVQTSLDIAICELGQKALPITIRRILPNGDYQNIPINYFIS
ncbi:MAG: DNA-directed RNA polymerase subunit K [Thaumarchaeota archaeon]|nr:DNA-directed RNA polymerase subunit K [Nitrososphaerota archaeon]